MPQKVLNLPPELEDVCPKDIDPHHDGEFHPEDYFEDLGVSSLSEDQKAVLQALWNILLILNDLDLDSNMVRSLLPQLFNQSSEDMASSINPANDNNERS